MNNFYKSIAIKEINRLLWKLGTFKIRLLAFISPKVVYYSQEKLVVKVKLNRRTRNHLNSMYLGALVMGAELSAGLPYAYFATTEKLNFSLVFASMESKYLKRPDSHVYFEVQDLSIFESLLAETKLSGERMSKDVHVDAYIHYDSDDLKEKVATFKLELSVKVKNKK
jgi:hypothetical protein